jgi:hypothetical protein
MIMHSYHKPLWGQEIEVWSWLPCASTALIKDAAVMILKKMMILIEMQLKGVKDHWKNILIFVGLILLRAVSYIRQTVDCER